METLVFLRRIRDLIAHNDLPNALLQLRILLDRTPLLDEAILQSARFQDIRQQIRLGTVSNTEANLTQNQIRSGLLDLLQEMEAQATHSPDIHQELAQGISILHSKNVVTGNIAAGGNVSIGDTTQVTESNISRRLRVFLYFLVPLLAFTTTFFWYSLQRMREPLALTIAVDNRTPNPELPFEGGNVTLRYGDKSDTKPIRQEAYFTGIPANFRDKMLAVRFEAAGFMTIDTTFELSTNRLSLPIRRDNSLASVSGTVKDEQGNPLAGVQIRVQDLLATTDMAGVFSLAIPPKKQRIQQRVTAFLPGYKPWDNSSPVIENEEIAIVLKTK